MGKRCDHPRYLKAKLGRITPATVAEALEIVRRVLQQDGSDELLDDLTIGLVGRPHSTDPPDSEPSLALYTQLFDLLGDKLTSLQLRWFAPPENPLAEQLLVFLVDTCLPKCPQIQSLAIACSTLDGLDGSTLAQFYAKAHARLQSFELCSCCVTIDFLRQWKQGMLNCPQNQLSKLKLTGMAFVNQTEQAEEYMEMFELVKVYPYFECRSFHERTSSFIRDDHIKSFASIFRGIPMLKQLHAQAIFPSVGCEAIEVFFGNLSKLNGLQDLTLHALTSATLPSITTYLESCQQMSKLELIFENDEVLQYGPALDAFVGTVASLPALEEFRITANVDSPATFLSFMLKHLIEAQSQLIFLSIFINFTNSLIDECWLQQIPHLGPHLCNFNLNLDAQALKKDPKWPDLISAMMKNGYFTNISFGYQPVPEITCICKRNKLLAEVQGHGCLKMMTPAHQQWALLLAGVANHSDALDQTALFLFVQNNVSNICFAMGKA